MNKGHPEEPHCLQQLITYCDETRKRMWILRTVLQIVHAECGIKSVDILMSANVRNFKTADLIFV